MTMTTMMKLLGPVDSVLLMLLVLLVLLGAQAAAGGNGRAWAREATRSGGREAQQFTRTSPLARPEGPCSAPRRPQGQGKEEVEVTAGA
jgi:hypothetical protein